MNSQFATRRSFLKKTGATAAGLYVAGAATAGAAEKLALEGGSKTVTKGPYTRWPQFTQKAIDAAAKLAASPNYGTIDKFEKAWKEYFDVPFAKAHCNGTSAFGASFFALDLPPGSEVLVTTFSTWFPLSQARLVGLVPKFVDVDPNTLNICVEDMKKKYTSKCRAIMPVHWWGLPCDMEAICDFAKEKGLDIVEDSSHAHGSKIKGKYIGKWGRIGTFSLQGSKPCPSIEGGIANFKTERDWERATLFGHYKFPGSFPSDSPYKKYASIATGSKLRMHPISAILAKDSLDQLEEHNAVVIKNAKALNARIAELPGLSIPKEPEGCERVYYSTNMVLFDAKKAGFSRSKLIKALNAEGVSASSWGWSPLHSRPYFQEAQWWHHAPEKLEAIPGCEQANASCVSMPLFRKDDPELVDQYVKAFEKVWANKEKLA